MNFNKHLTLDGKHAFLSASKYHWVHYDIEKLSNTYTKFLATQMGTRLHAFAKECIDLGIKLPKTKNTMNMYINDAIGFKMTTEQTLYYSENCFGTADAIMYSNKQSLLRIHDLKTGISPGSMRQLEIYTALFCLEYNIPPNQISIELRLYQSNDILVHEPTNDDILYIMDKIIIFDQHLNKIKI